MVETAAGVREGVETEREVGVMVAAERERATAEAEAEAETEKEVEAREVGETEMAEAGAVKESMKCPK